MECGQIEEVGRLDVETFSEWIIDGGLRIDLNALSVEFEGAEVGVVRISEHFNDVQFRHSNRLNKLEWTRII